MKKYLKYITIVIFLGSIITQNSTSQVTGESYEFNPDTVFIFKSPRELLTLSSKSSNYREAAGLDLLFSNSGFALGGFYKYFAASDWAISSKLFITSSRNTDEIEYFDYWTGNRIIPGKINRLYSIPLTLTAQKFLFQETLEKSLKPYIQVGFGPTFILSTPYSKSFFDAFNYAKWYVRPGGFVGIGAVISSKTNSFIGVNIDYYIIPFGGDGLESIEGSPIKDFGGLFLSLSLGGLF